jgi:hypothetical protein
MKEDIKRDCRNAHIFRGEKYRDVNQSKEMQIKFSKVKHHSEVRREKAQPLFSMYHSDTYPASSPLPLHK